MKRPWQKPTHKTTKAEWAYATAWDGAVFVLVMLLALALASLARSAELRPGDVLVSKNADESQNTSPGDANHLAIAISPTEIVESQAGIGVQKISLSEYLSRPYSSRVCLSPLDRGAGERAAAKAASLVGLKFRKLSSIFRRQGELRQKRGFNCVSVVKASYWDADRRVRRIKIPDDIYKLKDLFHPPQPLALSGVGDSWWFVHKPRNAVDGKGIFRELLSRCPSYGLAQIRDFDQATQCHEATHFVNGELSRGIQQSYGAFYVGDGRFCVLRAPQVTIGMVAKRVPQAQRNGRYDMYLTGDRVGRNCLSILDEWTCYANDAQCTRELKLPEDGGLKHAQEFSGFADCLVQTVNELDPQYVDREKLTAFVAWQKQRVQELSR